MDITENSSQIRIERIKLSNYKGVTEGVVEFNCFKRPFEKDTQSDILGLYGQNGSGKTTLLEALDVAKRLMMGCALSLDDYSGLISQSADHARIEIMFQVINPDNTLFHLEYAFSLALREFVPEVPGISDNLDQLLPLMVPSAIGASATALSTFLGPAGIISALTTSAAIGAIEGHRRVKKAKESIATSKNHIVVFDEVLSLSGIYNGNDYRFAPVFDTRSEDIPFLPKAKHSAFFPQKTSMAIKELTKFKARARAASKSFIFSEDVKQLIFEQIFQDGEYKEDAAEFSGLILMLIGYASRFIKVQDSMIIGASLFNEIPLYTASRCLKIDMADSTTTISNDEDLVVLQKCISGLNVILKQLIPGLTLEAVEQVDIDSVTGKTVKKSSKEKRITVYTVRDNTRILLTRESPGIMKLISSLGLIACAFSNPSVTVAIDEIDAGVYEYLLGELLLIFEESGQGQLIFTCHNLRPLEVLEKKYIYFTTTNPENRYLKPKSIRKENNLRDVYLREIITGGQDEELYSSAKHIKIASALRKAGEIIA